MTNETTLSRVVRHEGFKSKPYMDTLGKATIGHGLTYLTFAESFGITSDRLEVIESRLRKEYTWLEQTPDIITSVLTEMVYQMGYDGVKAFKRMYIALERQDFVTAAEEMLDSKWALQTPERAQHLADLVRGRPRALPITTV